LTLEILSRFLAGIRHDPCLTGNKQEASRADNSGICAIGLRHVRVVNDAFSHGDLLLSNDDSKLLLIGHSYQHTTLCLGTHWVTNQCAAQTVALCATCWFESLQLLGLAFADERRKDVR
jgi:hypothetical protein